MAVNKHTTAELEGSSRLFERVPAVDRYPGPRVISSQFANILEARHARRDVQSVLHCSAAQRPSSSWIATRSLALHEAGRRALASHVR